MEKGKSNIVLGSNVFLSTKKNPYFDASFVLRLEEYEKVKNAEWQGQHDNRIPQISPFQKRIIRNETRCIKAKNDPCWGYKEEIDRFICDCVNGSCPDIMRCNPEFSREKEELWKVNHKEKQAYGNPESMKTYYFVDLISDEEMETYKPEYINRNRAFPTEEKKDLFGNYRKTKVDPITGKLMIVVGHKWVISDNGSYENDELVEIWDYADEVELQKSHKIIRKKAKKIEKKKNRDENVTNEPIKEAVEVASVNYESQTRSRIGTEIKLTEIDDRLLTSALIIIKNEAERAYVSNTLCISEIEHSFVEGGKTRIALYDDISKDTTKYKDIYISKSLLNENVLRENQIFWKVVSQSENIFALRWPDRDFCELKSENIENRWCIRNMYGTTHVVVKNSDIIMEKTDIDGWNNVKIVGSSVVNYSGQKVGNVSNEFLKMIQELKLQNEIDADPTTIEGLVISMKHGELEVLGLGRLKFDKY